MRPPPAYGSAFPYKGPGLAVADGDQEAEGWVMSSRQERAFGVRTRRGRRIGGKTLGRVFLSKKGERERNLLEVWRDEIQSGRGF